MLGYQGYATLDDTTFLFTGGGVSKSRQRLDSGAVFGGQNCPFGVGMGVPHNYDYDEYSANLEFELDDDLSLLDLLVAWLLSRNTSKEIVIAPNGENPQPFDAYWNSMSFSGNTGALVTGSLDLTVVKATLESGVENYPKNDDINTRVGKVGEFGGCSIFDFAPLPYWKTILTVGSTIDCLSWTVNFHQDVMKLYACKAESEAQEAKYVGFGPLRGDFNFEAMMTTPTPVNVATPILQMGIGGTAKTFTFTNAELDSFGTPLKGASDITSVPIAYQLYGFVYA